MYQITVLLTNTATAAAALTTCARLAEAFAPAEVRLLHARPDVDPNFMPSEEVYTEERKREFESTRDNLLEGLVQAVAPWRDNSFPELKQIRGKLEEVAKHVVSDADLVIMGGPNDDADAKTILNCALLEADKPFVLVSRNVPASVGRHIAIAWAPGDAPKRAIEAIQPILEKAEQVTVLMGTKDNEFLVALPKEILLLLEAANRKVREYVFDLADRDVGEALLGEARKAGADLLVMGAFTHSRFREWIFGGATAEILHDLDIPVLMQH
jgi:nucleotide-binding universal stress UspA family protein